MIKKCECCKKEFNGKPKQKYCSRECSNKIRYPKYYVKCSNCNKEFKKTKSQIEKSEHHYCSEECKKEHYKIRFTGENNPNFKNKTFKVVCDCCGVEFDYRDYHGERNHRYCSQKCKQEHQKQLLLGENNPNFKNALISVNCSYCKKEFKLFRHKITNKSNVFCCNECYYDWMSENRQAENNINWNSNTNEEEREKQRRIKGYNTWKRKVRKKYNYTCQCCGLQDKEIGVHHILNYSTNPDLRTDENNGICLCKSCHYSFHGIYGYSDNNYEQLNDFLHNHKKQQ